MASTTRPTRWTCGWCRVKEYTETSKPPEGWTWVARLGLRCPDCYVRLNARRARWRAQVTGVPKRDWPKGSGTA